MKTNVGPLDRMIRLLLGLGLLAAGYHFRSWWGLIGAVPLLTAAVGFCPLYPLLGLNTARRRD